MNGLHITVGHGKMKGIPSINTPASTNPFCQKMSKTDSICKSCYATRNESFRKNLIPAFERNVKILLNKDFKSERLSHNIMRLHSYGELYNTVHLASFFKLVFGNPYTMFALWTKRSDIIQAYIRKGGVVPSNINLIFSNPTVDTECIRPPKGFDKVFNVHTTKGVKDSGIDINCGSKSCTSCMICYSKNSITVVNEKRK